MESDLTNLDWLGSFQLETMIRDYSNGNIADDKYKTASSQNEKHIPQQEQTSPSSQTGSTKSSGSGSSSNKTNRLPCTFSCYIFKVLEACHQKALPLQSIYNEVLCRFPQVMSQTQWKRSIRHSLSSSQCFVRIADEFAEVKVGKLSNF